MNTNKTFAKNNRIKNRQNLNSLTEIFKSKSEAK